MINISISKKACFTWGLLVLFSLTQQMYSQIIIKGKVTDASNAEPIPFATVLVKGTEAGVNTDFNGDFELKLKKHYDSLTVQYVGYKPKSKSIQPDVTNQVINFQLETATNELEEIIIVPGENPAWPILRNVVKNKVLHSMGGLRERENLAYTRTEICLDNISEKLKKNFILGNVATIIDNAKKVAGEDGKPVIPVFVSEVISKNYSKPALHKSKELIVSTKTSGIGMNDNTVMSQFLGSGLQNINFYQNYSTILTKDFVSPICDEWRINYKYYLIDSLIINDRFCYEIKFVPKNKHDLAYTGRIWIDKEDYALVRIDAQILKESNINYVENIKVQQEFIKKEDTWLNANSRLIIDLAELSNYSSGVLIKTNSARYNYVFTHQSDDFYNTALEVSDSLQEKNFDSLRPVKLTHSELEMYRIIDSVKNIPKVRSWLETMDFLISGYQSVGKIDIGPYTSLYAYNAFEKHRFRIGFRTNNNFSKDWIIKGYAAFTTGDPTFFKPTIDVSRIISRKKFCEVGVKYHFDAEQIGLNSDNINFNTNLGTALFSVLSRFGPFHYPYYLDEFSVYCNTELWPGISQSLTFRNRQYKPRFPFAYRINPDDNFNYATKEYFDVDEFIYDFRYSPGEYAIRTKRNKRVRVKPNRNNFIYTLKYTWGSKLLGDFGYHKINAGISKSFRMGFLGRSTVDVQGGYIRSHVPLPLLYIHQGNESYVYIKNGFNTMNYLEFVSDRYINLNYFHNFEGLMFNRIPLIQKLGWRTHAGTNVLFGKLSPKNKKLHAEETNKGLPTAPVKGLHPEVPFVEVNYGISNILKCLRLDFIHRLTYLNKKDVTPFAVMLSIEIKL